MAYRYNETEIATLNEALFDLNVDDLKKLVHLLPTNERPSRKADLVDLLKAQLSGDRLRALWELLDETQQQALSETLYAGDGLFNHDRFFAKYGKPAALTIKQDRYSGKPTKLALFIYKNRIIPNDLKAALRAFAPRPAAVELKPTAELPETIPLDGWEYDPATKQSHRVTTQIPLVRCETERAAQQDLPALLRLIDKGKVAVSDKTRQASGATMKEIAALLYGGDFYPVAEPADKWEQVIGPIKAFAWPLLLQAGKLAELHGKKLALTKTGRAALGKPAHETLRDLWHRWLPSKLLDEFNRMDEIKGQSGKAKRGFTAAADRRHAIAGVLAELSDEWVSFDEFGRFLRACDCDFEVTRDPWGLYIGDANYASLGYAGHHDWPILQGRYALCFLFEYAATLGLLDVAYIEPAGARHDYGDLWGTDDLRFLSRYDGLLYFRLNELGAYCLGLIDDYTPSRVQARTALSVLPSLQIKLTGGAFLPEEALLLETWAIKESDANWRLDRDKALSAVESGHDIAELRAFLAARDEQELPDTVIAFIVTTERNARALKPKGTALLIECAHAELAALLATHEWTKKLCQRAGEKHLVVKETEEEAFRKAAHVLGYGMPRG